MDATHREKAIRCLGCVGILLFVLPFSAQAQAAEFCVTTAAELQAAFPTAAGNGEDDTIRIVQGTHVGNFVYASHEAYGLTIEGGYTRGYASPTVDPASTVLDGNAAGNVLVTCTDRATPARSRPSPFRTGQH